MMDSMYIITVVIMCLQLSTAYHQQEIKSIPIPSEVDEMFIYTLYTAYKTWNEAYEICNQNGGGRLVTVSSLGVLNFIKEQELSSWSGYLIDDYWIGLSEPTEGQFIWQDCSYSSNGFSHFKGDAYKADELCYNADISQEHKWTNAKCSDAKKFICENTRDCNLTTTMVSNFDFKNLLTTETMCNEECDRDLSCWGVLSFGTFGCYILKLANAPTTNGVVNFNSKSCSCQALMVTDSNVNPGIVDSSLTPRVNCSSVHENSVTASVTVETSTFALSPSTPYLTTGYSTVTTSPHEIYIYNCTNNFTVRETQINTEILSVTNFINIVSTVFDIHQESVYITVFVTSSDVFTESCSCLQQSVCINIANCSYSETKTSTMIDSLQLENSLESIRKELVVNKNATSAYLRKFISIADNRTSATAIGYVGATFLALIILLILISDFPKCIRSFKKCISSYRGIENGTNETERRS